MSKSEPINIPTVSGVVDIENDIEIEDIDLTSFVYSDATLDTILCASEPPTFG